MNLVAIDDLDAQARGQVDDALKQFSAEWDYLEPPALDGFLSSAGPPVRARLLVELVKLDLKLHWRAGVPRRVEHYLHTHPELDDNNRVLDELVQSECRTRATFARLPTADELQTRFPTLASSMRLEEIETAAAAARAEESFAGTGRFFLIRKIGAGGMGVVYEALDRERAARVALKTLPRVRPDRLQRFKHEFRSLAEIVHLNLVPLYEFHSDGTQWFFTMELIVGVDLLKYLWPPVPDDQAAALSGPGNTEVTVTSDKLPADDGTTVDAAALPSVHPHSGSARRWTPDRLERLRDAFRQLAEAVAAIHKADKVHRDIKPSNVLVTEDGHLRLLDFGLVAELNRPDVERGNGARDSHTMPHTHETGADSIVGTVAYMAPEQAAGRALTNASDWYAIGIMLYEALTGCLPFAGRPMEVILAKQHKVPSPPAELMPGIPEDLNSICQQLLARDPAERLSGAELLAALTRGEAAPEETDLLARPELGPFVGREDYLATLQTLFETMLQGRAATVHISGPSGLGKSSLVEHFLGGLARRDDVVILGSRCYEQESVPYKALDGVVDALSHYLLRLPDAQIVALTPPHIAALARMFPVLQQVSAVADAVRTARAIPDLRQLRQHAFSALHELLLRIGRQHPLVVFIDDLQWGDVDSAELLSGLLRAASPPRMLLVACYRSEQADASGCLKTLKAAGTRDGTTPTYAELKVDRLTHDETRRLVTTLLADAGVVDRAVAERIARESRGSPYFIYELVRHVCAGSDATQPTSRTSHPDLDEVLWMRISDLPPAARKLLEVISVAGKPLRLDVAYAAAELTTGQRSATVTLRAQHLVRSTGPGLRDEIETYHARIRETTQAHLTAVSLKTYHHRLANSLESAGDADAETVARHFESAGEFGPAGTYYARAADISMDALAFDHAAALYRRSLETRPVGAAEGRDLRVRLGHALANAGRGYQAALTYQDAASDASEKELLELRRLAATQFCSSGHIDKGRAIFRGLLRQVGISLPERPSLALLSWLYWRARLQVRGLKYTLRDASEIDPQKLQRIDILWSATAGLTVVEVMGVAALQSRGLYLSLRAGEPVRLARALAWEALLNAPIGQRAAQRCTDLLSQAERLVQQIGQPHALGMTRMAAGMIAFLQIRFADAIGQLEEAEQIFRDRCTGVWWELATTRTMLSWAHWHKGEFVELARRSTPYINDAQQRGDLYTLTNLGTVVSPHLRLAADDPAAAQLELDESMKNWPFQGVHMQHIAALFTQVHIYLYRDRGAAAWDHINQMWPTLRGSLQLKNQMARIMLLDARARSAVAAATDTRDETKRQSLLASAEQDARKIQREDVGWGRPFAARILAGVAWLNSNSAEAARQLQSATGDFDLLEMRLHAAAARRRLGQLTGGTDGRQQTAAADAVFAEQQIKNVDRMTAVYLPGFD